MRSGVPLETFLEHRLAQHLSRLPVEPARLPVQFSIEGGEVVSRGAESAARPPWLDAFLRRCGPAAVNTEILQRQGDAARLAARIDAQRTRVDDLTHDVETATRGVAIADPGDEAQAQQMGRPAIPPPLGRGLQIFAIVLLLAESWPLVAPCMEAAGLRGGQMIAEFQRDPVTVILASLFAVGAAASLFLVAHLTVRRALAAAAAQPSSRQRTWTVLAVLISILLTTAMAWAIAGARPGAHPPLADSYSRLTVFLAVLAIPFTSAWLFTVGSQLEQGRAQARALARTWDQEHYRILADISRRATALAEEESRLSQLDAERSAVLRRIQVLQQRSATAERLAADAAGEERQELAAIVQAVSAALDLDRYEYVRQASARGIVVTRPEAPAPAPLASTVRAPREVTEHNLGLAG